MGEASLHVMGEASVHIVGEASVHAVGEASMHAVGEASVCLWGADGQTVGVGWEWATENKIGSMQSI